MTKVLVTGGAGFIGANLIRHLKQRGYSVAVLDDFSTGRLSHLEGCGIRSVVGDILSSDLVNRLCEGIDAVVHLAARPGIPQATLDPIGTWRANVTGSLSILEACRVNRVSKVILASSYAALGDTVYGVSKRTGELLANAYSANYGLATCSLRFSNVYGSYSDSKSSVIAVFMRRILDEESLPVHGDGTQKRDFVHVGDVCQAIEKALASAGKSAVYHIGTAKRTSVNEVVEMLRRVTGRALVTKKIPGRPEEQSGDDVDYAMFLNDARYGLGYNPEVGLEEGLWMTWEWFKNHRED